MVKADAWETVRVLDSDKMIEVAALHTRDVDPRTGIVFATKAGSGSWFSVNRAGGWAELVQRDGEKYLSPFTGHERITSELIKMLNHRPQGLRARLSEWPLEEPVDIDELWELVPWRQAVRSSLRTKRPYWTQLAVGWIEQLDVGEEFAEDLIEVARASMDSLSTTVRRTMLSFAGLAEPDTLISYESAIDDSALAVAAMVADGAWESFDHQPSGETFDVTALHSTSMDWDDGTWFGVSRRGSWVEISRREDGTGFCTSFSVPGRLLEAGPGGLRERLTEWPLQQPTDVELLWGLVPWKQALRDYLNGRNPDHIATAISWIDQLGIAGEFADELSNVQHE